MNYDETLNDPRWNIHLWNGVSHGQSSNSGPMSAGEYCASAGCIAAIIGVGILFYKGCEAEGSEFNKEPLRIEQSINQDKEKSLSLQEKLVAGIEFYQKEVSPQLHQKKGVERICRYEPSCSEYAKQAIEQKGALLGSLDAAQRICSCNPWCEGGHDPVKSNKTQEHFRDLGKVKTREGFWKMIGYDWKKTKEDLGLC